MKKPCLNPYRNKALKPNTVPIKNKTNKTNVRNTFKERVEGVGEAWAENRLRTKRKRVRTRSKIQTANKLGFENPNVEEFSILK